MTASTQFVALVRDLLAPLEPVQVRRLFGGAGLFRDGRMFALIAGDSLYLKAGEETRKAFLAEGMRPFTYDTKRGPTVIQSYWRLPERLLDEPDELVRWCRVSIAVAERDSATSPRRRSREAESSRKPPADLSE